MSACCVPYCTANKRKCRGLSFFRFPQNEVERQRWIVNIRLEESAIFKLQKWTSVCSRHFQDSCFEPRTSDNPAHPRFLIKGSVPTLFEWNDFEDDLTCRKSPKKCYRVSDNPITSDLLEKSTCCVPLCTNDRRKKAKFLSSSGKRQSFHLFPKDQELKKEWLKRIRTKEGSNFQVSEYTTVCSAHFTDDDYKYKKTFSGRPTNILKSTAIPSVFKWTQKKKNRKAPKDRVTKDIPLTAVQNVESEREKTNSLLLTDNTSDSNRAKEILLLPADKSAEKDKVQPSIVWPAAKISDNDRLKPIIVLYSGKNSEIKEHCTAPSEDHDYIIRNDMSAAQKIKALEEHIEKLEATIKQHSLERFCLERFSTNDRLIKMYTGFPNYKTLKSFFLAISTFIPAMVTWCQMQKKSDLRKYYQSFRTKMQPIDQLFMFLNKLKLGSIDQDLADKFLVSQTTVSRNTITWANFLYFVLGSQPLWPSRQKVQQFMPKCFRDTYPKTRVIIDCIDINVQTPSSPELNSAFYSHSKGRATVKGIIGVTPSGAVSFVSNLYTGSTSAQTLMRGSGILNLLEEGDEVVGDQSLHIADIMKEKNFPLISLNCSLLPKARFTRKKATDNKALAEVELLVEKYIRLRHCKEFHIFESEIPLTLFRTINQLWAVACMLTNFQYPLIEASHDSECSIDAPINDVQYEILVHSDEAECQMDASTSGDQHLLMPHTVVSDIEC